jgi:DNA-binding NtrC family response regulator
VDNRVVAATNVDIERAVAEQRFRSDLYYRLGVIVIRVPPLKDRREDIPLLTATFLKSACERTGRQVQLSASALDMLVQHNWPGNVRQLENAIERLVLFSRGAMAGPDDVAGALCSVPEPVRDPRDDLLTLEEVQRRHVERVLQTVGGNRTRAAEVLGIDRSTLYRMAARFGIQLSDEK